jgi:uncharacterized protein
MRSLLDVNVLIALLDADHTSHATALAWFASHAGRGWASCPITQNGCVRIMSLPGYPNSRRVQEIMQRLHDVTSESVHEFWADDVSLLDEHIFDASRIHGARQLTDVYLLALAVKHGGQLVTMNAGIARTAVRGATAVHLLVL